MFENAHLQILTIGIAVTAAILVLSHCLLRRGNRQMGAERGHIAPDRPLILTAALVGLGLACIALNMTATQPYRVFAVLVGIGGLGLVLLAAMGLLPDHEIEWNEDGLEGPASTWLLPFGQGRDFIAWADVIGLGKDALGNWHVEDRTGDRICWSFVYGGHCDLIAAVERNCPHLSDPRPAAVA